MKTQKFAYKSDLAESIHTSAQDLYRIGAIDKVTMREFDESCLLSLKPVAPAQIRALRERTRMSQAVFARHLNTSVSTVQKWETGEKRPSGAALKLLDVVSRHGMDVLVQSVRPMCSSKAWRVRLTTPSQNSPAMPPHDLLDPKLNFVFKRLFSETPSFAG